MFYLVPWFEMVFMKAQILKQIEELPQLSQNKKIPIHGMVEEMQSKIGLTL